MGAPEHEPLGDPAALRALRAAAVDDLALIARLHHAELDDTTLDALRQTQFPHGLGFRLRSLHGQQALAHLAAVMADFSMPMEVGLRDELAADYAAIYLTYGYQASPCESVWLDEENLGMQAPMFQVREFYRFFDLVAEDWRRRSDDHLVLELQFLAWLLGSTNPQALPEAARFLDEHLLRWVPQFARRVATRCATPFYAGLATLTAAYCDELRDVLAQVLESPRPSAEAVEARMKPRPQAQAVPMTYMPGAAPSW